MKSFVKGKPGAKLVLENYSIISLCGNLFELYVFVWTALKIALYYNITLEQRY